MARIGDDGAEFLALYWQGQADLLRTAHGALAVVAGAIDLAAATAAVTVTLSPTIQVTTGPQSFAALIDTPAALTTGGFYRAAGGRLTERRAVDVLSEALHASFYARGDGRGGITWRRAVDILSEALATQAGRAGLGAAVRGLQARAAIEGLNLRGSGTSYRTVRTMTLRATGPSVILFAGSVATEAGDYRIRQTAPTQNTIWERTGVDRHGRGRRRRAAVRGRRLLADRRGRRREG